MHQHRKLESMHNFTRATALATIAVAATAVAAAVSTAAPAAAAQPAAVSPADQPAVPVAPAAPVDPGTAYTQAFEELGGAFATDSTAGRIAGSVAGAAVGCGLGAVTGGTLTLLVSAGTLTPLGAVGGCIIGAGTVGFVGGMVGSLATGVPAMAAAWPQTYAHLQAEHAVAAPLAGSPAEK